MAEHKYRFNPKTLNFERIRLTGWQKLKRTTLALAPGLLLGILGIFLVYPVRRFAQGGPPAPREPATAGAI
jgi:hypothetical protein